MTAVKCRGASTWDEMLYGVVRFRYVDEAAAPAETVSRTRDNFQADCS